MAYGIMWAVALSATMLWVGMQTSGEIISLRAGDYLLEHTAPMLCNLALAGMACVGALWSLIIRFLHAILRGARACLGGNQADLARILQDGWIASMAEDAPGLKRALSLMRRWFPHQISTPLLAARLAEITGDHARAVVEYHRLLEVPHTAPAGLPLLVRAHMEAGRWRDAMQLAGRAARSVHTPPWALRALLQIYPHMEAYDAWRGVVARAVRAGLLTHAEIPPLHARIWLEEGRYALRIGRARHARHCWEKALLAPYSAVEAGLHLAHLATQQGRPKQALRALEDAWRTQPDPRLLRTALALHHQQHPETSQTYIASLAAYYPSHPTALLAVASVALEMKWWGMARTHLVQAQRLGDSEPLCWMMLRLEVATQSDYVTLASWLDKALSYSTCTALSPVPLERAGRGNL